MKKKITDLFNTIKYKKKANKFENNYKSVLEEINPLKDEIIALQSDKIALLESNILLKKELKELKKKNEKRKG